MFLVAMLRHTRLVDALAVPTFTRCLVIVLQHTPIRTSLGTRGVAVAALRGPHRHDRL